MRKLEGSLTYKYQSKNLIQGWYLEIIFNDTLATLTQIGVHSSNETER